MAPAACSCAARIWVLSLLLLALGRACALSPSRGQRGVLLWQVQLSPEQCGAAHWAPCYNVYAVDEKRGGLAWFAFTTADAAIKGMAQGHHSVYYATWSGPGLYAVNAGSGHVRWQFPLDNWFRYWVKDIDLDHAASFVQTAEAANMVFVTAAGPPARIYGLRTKSGAREWEFKLPNASAVLGDAVAGPLGSSTRASNRARPGAPPQYVFAALNAGDDGSTSWVQALEMSSGAPAWTSQLLAGTTLQQLQLQDGLLLATAADAASIAAFNASSGVRLWQRRGAFCPTPSPIATVYDGRQLLLADSCASLEGLTAVDVATGEDLWRGWPAPSAAAPTGNCSGYAVDGGTVYFGCSCSIKNQLEAASSSSSRGIGVGAGAAGSSVDGLCLYAVSSHSGKLRWAQALPPGSSSSSSASFPEDAQAWGHAPVVAPHEGLVLFIAAAQVFAVSLSTGKLHWSLALPAGQALAAFSQPVVDGGAGVLLLAAQVDGGSSRSGRNGGGSSKTAMAAASLRTGRWVWTRSVNGTLQLPPAGPAAGAAPLLAYGGWLHMEACRGARCCLRALNTTSGKQGWGMCLDAVAGDDATHPRAKFAIWLVTLITVASIALLIAAACLVYIQRWQEERRILDGPPSPRHSYQPLPDPSEDNSEE